MGFHGRTAAHKPKITMCNAKLAGIGNTFSGSPMDESGFGRCQENPTYPNAYY